MGLGITCHRAVFETIGRVPRKLLYDRMKTAVIGDDEEGRVVYYRGLGDLASHYGFLAKALSDTSSLPIAPALIPKLS